MVFWAWPDLPLRKEVEFHCQDLSSVVAAQSSYNIFDVNGVTSGCETASTVKLINTQLLQFFASACYSAAIQILT